MKKAIFIIGIIALLFLASCSEGPEKKVEKRIASFDECVAAGNPVMESYPRQCRADGELFVEKIDRAPENTADVSCATDDDCETPMEYLIRSDCPYSSKCIEGRCEIVCRFPESDGTGASSECPDPRPEMCTMDFDPVCGYSEQTIYCIRAPCPPIVTKKTYGNACTACADSKVTYWIQGECQQ